jgi:diguanylate cyclase (GGDEF)-like protein/PAS domain S-box-containing protein
VKFPFLRTIRTHLLLLVLICILPALGIIIYSGLNRSYREIERAKSDALQVIKNFSYDHERAMESTRQFLMTLAKVPDIQNLNVTQSSKLLRELLKQNPLYSTLFVVDAQGFVHASGHPLPPAPVSVMQRKYFQDMVSQKDFSVGEYAICPAVKRPVLHFAYPIFDTGGQFKGMVALSLDLTHYAKMFPMDQLPQDSTLSFSDHKGIFLYRFPGNEDNIPKPDLLDMIKHMSAQKEGVFTYTGVDGLIRLYAYKNFRIRANEPAYLFMRVGIPEKKALLHARKALSVNLVLLGIAFIGALFSAWFLGNAIIVRRLNKLVKASRRIGHGDLKTRTGLNHKSDELGELGKAFDEMAGALEKKYIEHKQAEEKSKKIADEWQTTFDSITDLVMILDNEFRMIRVNEATLRFFNLPMDRILGNSCFPLVYGMNEPPEPNPFTEMRRTKKHEEAELYLTEKGIWLFLSADPILDGEGNIIGLVHIVKDITDRKKAEEALRESEKKFKDLVEKSNVGVYLVQDGVDKYLNARCAEIHGYSVEEMINKIGPKDTTFPEDWVAIEENIRKRMSGEVELLHHEFRIITKNQEIKNVEIFGSRTVYQGRPAVIGTMLDITDRKRAEEKLRESEERFRQLAENIREAFYIYEEDTNQLCYISPAYKEIWGCLPSQSLYQEPKYLLDAVYPDDKDRVKRSLVKRSQGEVEEVYRIVRSDGSIRWIKDRSFPVYDSSGKMYRIVGIASDITDHKMGEEKLKYLSLHDSLTGLYNRIYFEEEINRIEKARYDTVGVVSCDVDGLKLVNDTLGHDQGDNLLVAAARVIRESFRDGDLVARIGGDEFSVILPNTTESAVENACQRIQEAVANHNALHPELPLSISIGFAVSNGVYRNLKDLFKDADNNMYLKKLYYTQNVRSTIVNTLINTLKTRDLTTERHVTRLEKLLADMASLIGLPESATSDLSLLAKFHDIGKVGVSDSIIFKKGPLTSEEWIEVKRHCEIGYRIALSASDLIPVADWILKHHEWWNGDGYPLGIKGEEIPIECRILAITEAYEAMTSVRPYRRAFSHGEAVAELLRHSGTQFDPELLEKFVQMLEAHPPESETDVTSAN